MPQLKEASFAFFKTAFLVVMAGVSPRVAVMLVELGCVAAGRAEEDFGSEWQLAAVRILWQQGVVAFVLLPFVSPLAQIRVFPNLQSQRLSCKLEVAAKL